MIVDPFAFMGGDTLARIGGKVIVAASVRYWGKPGTGPSSEMYGGNWSFANYLIGMLAAWAGGELAGRFISAPMGQEVYKGGYDLVFSKLVWTELIARSPTAQTYLGQGDEMAVLAQQANEGDLLDDGSGNRWIMKGGRWVAMQGVLEPATALDGVLEPATALDGYYGRPSPYGHLMPPDTSEEASRVGQFVQRGSKDPYHAAYL